MSPGQRPRLHNTFGQQNHTNTTLFGDRNGDYRDGMMSEGTHTVTASIVGQPDSVLTISFQVSFGDANPILTTLPTTAPSPLPSSSQSPTLSPVARPSPSPQQQMSGVTAFALIDTIRQQSVGQIEDGDTVYLPSGGEKVNIVADTVGTTERVELRLDTNQPFRKEKVAPFGLFGGTMARGFLPGQISEGVHTMMATQFPSQASMTVVFAVIYDCALSAIPCPA